MVIIFSLVNIFISYIKAVLFFKTLVIVVASLIFFALFALSYKYANDEELFLDKENNSK